MSSFGYVQCPFCKHIFFGPLGKEVRCPKCWRKFTAIYRG